MPERIPRQRELPIRCSEREYGEIAKWMRSQPESANDASMMWRARWKYSVIDDGLCSLITVEDRDCGGVFRPTADVENW